MFKQFKVKHVSAIILIFALCAGLFVGCNGNNGKIQQNTPDNHSAVNNIPLDPTPSSSVGSETPNENQDETGGVIYGHMTTGGQSVGIYTNSTILTQNGDTLTLDVEQTGPGGYGIVAIYDETDEADHIDMNADAEAIQLEAASIAEQEDIEKTDAGYIVKYYSNEEKYYLVSDSVVCFTETNDHSVTGANDFFVCEIEEILKPIYNGYDYYIYVENDEVMVIYAQYNVKAVSNREDAQ